MRRERRNPVAAEDAGFDPLTDLFFTMAAVVLAILAALVPTLYAAKDRVAGPESVASRLQDPSISLRLDGRPVIVLAALADGIRFDERTIGLNGIQNDAELTTKLVTAAGNAQPVLAVIAPDGQESAFLLDIAMARAGLNDVWQVRLDRFCAFAVSSAAATLCRPDPGQPGPRP